MSEIKVETGDLRSGSQSLSSVGGEIGAARGEVLAVTSHYGGRLGEELAAIVGRHEGAGSGLESRAHSLSQELLNRAIGFERANQAGIAAFAADFSALFNLPPNSPVARWLSKIFGAHWSKAVFIWGAGGLGSFMSLRTLILNPQTMIGSSIGAGYLDRSASRFLGIGSRVLADDKEIGGIFWRNSSNPAIKSNCTYYASAAVYEAHGFKFINYEKDDGTWFQLGDGGDWAANADAARSDPTNRYFDRIANVNKLPKTGSVYSGPSGGGDSHVYFVEHAELGQNAQGERVWRVVLSEENYQGGGAMRDAFTVDTPRRIDVADHPEVARHTRIVEYPVAEDGSASIEGKFIHFKSPGGDLSAGEETPSASLK